MRRRNREQETGESHVMDSEVMSSDGISEYNSIASNTSSDDEETTRDVDSIHDETDVESVDEEEINDEVDNDDYVYSFNMLGKQTESVVIEDLKGKDGQVFNQGSRGTIIDTWILLDSCSTVNIFSNHRFLQNIRTVYKELHLYTNAGKSVINRVGYVPGFGTVWYHQHGITQVL